MNEKQKNYYEILEIPIDATYEEVKQGYKSARNAYSGDSLALYSIMSKEECDNILSLIEEAYSIISDPVKRAKYDEARGFNSESHSTRKKEMEFNTSPVASMARETISKPKPNAQNKMTKLMATKRFALEYTVDPEFEKEIESATEFSGEFLQKIREYRNVDILRLAEMTKISKTYLKKIEEEDTQGLPALVYVRGFVYQYAKCLKLNPDLVATSYLHRLKSMMS
jgi:curved DNA-binding protein CbpA